MMNKNFALIALVLGFSVVASVQAADIAREGELEFTAGGIAFTPPYEAMFDADAVATDVVTEATTLGWMKNKTVAGYESVKGQCVAHPKTAIAITAVSASAIALLVDLKVRGNKSVLAQAWNKLSRKSAQTIKRDIVAELVAAKQN